MADQATTPPSDYLSDRLALLLAHPGDTVILQFGDWVFGLDAKRRRALLETLREDVRDWQTDHPSIEFVLVPPGLDLEVQ